MSSTKRWMQPVECSFERIYLVGGFKDHLMCNHSVGSTALAVGTCWHHPQFSILRALISIIPFFGIITPIQKPRVGKTCGAEGIEFCPYTGDIPIMGWINHLTHPYFLSPIEYRDYKDYRGPQKDWRIFSRMLSRFYRSCLPLSFHVFKNLSLCWVNHHYRIAW